MDALELISFKVISAAGSAKSSFVESIQASRKRDFDEAQRLIDEGEALRLEGHEAHFELIQKEANGESLGINLLLMHAEDQLMASETVKMMAEEMLENYKTIQALEDRIDAK